MMLEGEFIGGVGVDRNTEHGMKRYIKKRKQHHMWLALVLVLAIGVTGMVSYGLSSNASALSVQCG